MRIHACMPARTHSSSTLLAPQAVSHPSIHVTERWVHPVTGQLVAVTLIYVAPLSSLFLLWWRDYVCSLPIRKVYSARNGGPVWELSQTGVGRRAPAWANCVIASSLGSIILYHCFCSFVIYMCCLTRFDSVLQASTAEFANAWKCLFTDEVLVFSEAAERCINI